MEGACEDGIRRGSGITAGGGRWSYDASRRQGGEERGHTFVVSDLIYTSQPEDIDLHCDTEPL